ncbi:MAG: type II toxin-antitoxin system PemK/MazF family toxin [Desulfobacterales bacterium]|nr:type II toxin-antitoxin system PemK/MazF family toxin [Desulfobacterales bacterium]MBF0395563.1 type II toxin-antitoxin system PemK/MazF family toxin [Desulfobacterales bacterium]
MGKFIKGDIVVVPFPFSDLSHNKKRPALVVATMLGDDIILCQITSKSVSDSYAILISDSDFKNGGLQQESNIRPNRIFTADSKIIIRRVGSLTDDKVQDVINKIIKLIND